jgi:M6 family metalloprotease-like protein
VTRPIARDAGTLPRALTERREFPDDLYAPGAVTPVFRTVSELLRVGLAAAAAEPAPDTLRLAVFRVDFLRDSAGDSTTGDGRFDLRTGVTGVPVDPPPHNKLYFEAHTDALARYYAAQSYGSLVIVPTIYPADPDSAYHLSDTGDFGPWAVSQADSVIVRAERFVTAAVRAADASGDIDFSAYGAFVVVHAGADYQSDINRDTGRDIPTFTLSLGESLTVSTGKVGRVLVLPETVSQDGGLGALNGVFAHEFGHVLGLPDLYNIFTGVPQVGYWSLMDSGENIPAIVVDPETEEEFEAVGIFPTSFDPWSKLQAFPKGVAPFLVEEHWSDVLEAAEVNPGIPYVVVDDYEYFLVENRALDVDGNGFPFVRQDAATGVFMGPVDDPDLAGQGGRLEYDAVLPGGGLLIWHIDDRFVIPALADRGQVNLWTKQRGIAIVEADGTWDQGRYDLGTPEDAFYLDNNPRLGPETIPSSAANDGAWSGVSIETSSNPGRFMNVTIERAGARSGWPVYLPWTSEVTTTLGGVVPLDLDGGGAEILFGLERAQLVPPGGRAIGVGAVKGDGSPYVTTLFGAANNGLLSRLAASPAFQSRAGDGPSVPVVAGSETGGLLHLWDASGAELLRDHPVEPARTPPVIWPSGAGADRVLFGGTGGLFAVFVPGDVLFRSEPQTLAGVLPKVGPVLIPNRRVSGDAVPSFSRAALAFAGGRLAAFDLGDAEDGVVTEISGGEIAHLVAGFPDSDQEPRLVAITERSVFVLALSRLTSQLGVGPEASWALPAGMGTVSHEIALGDLDGDGLDEIAALGDSGLVAVWNGDGSYAVGWPRLVVGPGQDLKIVDLDGDEDLDLLVLDGEGRFHGFDGRGHELSGYPRVAGSAHVSDAFVADLDGDGRLTWVGTGDYGELLAFRLPGARPMAGDWRFGRGDVEGRGFQAASPADPAAAEGPDLGPDRLLIFPNPARRAAEIRFLLDDNETAQLKLFDLTGTEITDARLDPRGGFHPGENAVRWDLDGVAPGLYLCRLERHLGSGDTVEMAKIVVMR